MFESLGGSVCFQACVASIKRLWPPRPGCLAIDDDDDRVHITCVKLRSTFNVRRSTFAKNLQRGVVAKRYKLCYRPSNKNIRPRAVLSMTADAIFLLPVPCKSTPNVHCFGQRFKPCAFGDNLRGTGSKSMASGVIETAAFGRKFILQ